MTEKFLTNSRKTMADNMCNACVF